MSKKDEKQIISYKKTISVSLYRQWKISWSFSELKQNKLSHEKNFKAGKSLGYWWGHY